MRLADLPHRFSRLLDNVASDPARPSRWRGAGWGVFLALVWMFYLIGPIHDRWTGGDRLRSGLAGAAVIALSVLIATTFALYQRRTDSANVLAEPGPIDPRVWLPLGAMSLISAGLMILLGFAAFPTLLYVAATAVLVLPTRESGYVVVAVVGVTLLLSLLIPGWGFGVGTMALCLIPVGIWFGREVGTRGKRLREIARRQQSELTIVEERNRVARDVHDILGHSLTVITVKTELAGRLVDLDPERAKTEIAEVERLAREALAGVRDTVGGLREMSLAGELATARTALHAAGIRADLPVVVDVPTRQSVVFGWVLREAVTNIVRHSEAAHCTVRVDATSIEVTDDGIGMVSTAASGSGLTGLRERMRAAGGTLELGAADGGGLRLRATLS
ncbi:sensor histidine kinase [Nocardia pseudobrasiliensis]|uniref:Two-component system sensor histidine kinase DesK n=1 Tax=Nocardia pseudobrasiliensis TaxID=45979 RepID=A0A370HZX8_9NOCA|nr:sensor histidine kinase [Nocardia pseudobrasiliensis]RDI64029.1 two-component system sensor histidine kinase DesK [Nocardia pseudobrasiliensis]